MMLRIYKVEEVESLKNKIAGMAGCLLVNLNEEKLQLVLQVLREVYDV